MDIKDVNGVQVKEGDTIEITVQSWDGSRYPIIRGKVTYFARDLSSYGAGYAVVEENGRHTFLASFSRSGTQIEVI